MAARPRRMIRLSEQKKQYLSAHSLDAILNDYKKDNNKEEARELTAA